MLYETNTEKTVNVYYEIETENGKYFNFKRTNRHFMVDMPTGKKIAVYHVLLAFNDLQMQGYANFLGDSVYAVAILVNGETIYDNIRKNIDSLGVLVSTYNKAKGTLEEKMFDYVGNAFDYIDMALLHDKVENVIAINFFDLVDSLFREGGKAYNAVDISSVVAQTEALYIVGKHE